MIDYDDKPMQLETEDDRMAETISSVGAGELPTYVGTLVDRGRHDSRLLPDAWSRRDSPKHSPAHKTPPVAGLFEHWKEQFRTVSWVALAYQGGGGEVLQDCSQYSQILARFASL